MVSRILLESPFWLGAACFVLFAAVLLLRRRFESDRARAWAIPAVLLLAAALFVLQWAVTTDREAILDAMDAFADAVAARDHDAIALHIDDAYDGEGMDRGRFLEWLRDALTQTEVYDARFLRRDVSVVGDEAALSLRAVATVRIRGGVGETHFGDWELRWRRGPDGWRIARIRPRMIDNVNIDSLGALRGHLP